MKNEEQVVMEVFREHLDECLRHFSERVTSTVKERSRNAAIFRKPMVDFLGVSDGTVQRLLYGLGSVPSGENRLKLMFYLDLNGYKVIELEQMRRTKVLGNFAELIGYSILSATEAAQLAGYSGNNGNDASSLYQVFRGEVGLGKDKEERMWTIWKRHKDDISRKRSEAFEKCRLKFEPKPSPPPIFQKSELFVLTSMSHKGMLHIMDGLLSFMREYSFEKLSSEDLEMIRVMHGSNILELSARIRALGAHLIESEKKEKAHGQ